MKTSKSFCLGVGTIYTMKKMSFFNRVFALALCASIFSCETSTEIDPAANPTSNPKKINTNNENLTAETHLGSSNKESVLAAACEEYSLVLSGNTGTPHIGGLQSYLVNVNIATGVTTAASMIHTLNSAGIQVPIESMTGITKVQGNTLYGVTGINSTTPQSLFIINPVNGLAQFVNNTVIGNTTSQIALQDIERYTQNGRYYAIQEGTNRIFSSNNAINWNLFATVPTPNNLPLNGLAFRNNRLWVISSPSNTLCAGNFSNMYQYNPVNGILMGTSSYNLPAANITWTNKECGLTFYNPGGCVAKNFTVGSAMGILSHNMNLCPGVPVFISQIKPTYDWAKP
jgi:hypothetical protein